MAPAVLPGAPFAGERLGTATARLQSSRRPPRATGHRARPERGGDLLGRADGRRPTTGAAAPAGGLGAARGQRALRRPAGHLAARRPADPTDLGHLGGRLGAHADRLRAHRRRGHVAGRGAPADRARRRAGWTPGLRGGARPRRRVHRRGAVGYPRDAGAGPVAARGVVDRLPAGHRGAGGGVQPAAGAAVRRRRAVTGGGDRRARGAARGARPAGTAARVAAGQAGRAAGDPARVPHPGVLDDRVEPRRGLRCAGRAGQFASRPQAYRTGP